MYEATLLLSACSLAAICVIFYRMKCFSIFHPLFWYLCYHALVFVVRPIFGYIFDYQILYHAYNFQPSPSDKATVIIASNLGMIAFAFLSLRTGNAPMRFARSGAAKIQQHQLMSLLPWVVAICLPLGAYSAMVSYQQALQTGSGFGAMRLVEGTGTFVNTDATGYFADAQMMAGSICVIIAWAFRFRLLSLLPLATFCLFRLATGSRVAAVSCVAMAAILYWFDRRVTGPKPKVLVALFALAALFSLIGADRGAGLRGYLTGQQVEASASDPKLKPLESMDIAGMEFFEYLVYVVPQRSGSYDLGLSNLQLFTEPIPRKWWPGKPVGAPIKRVLLWDYGTPIGITYSLPGAGWFMFGWIGVILWCGLVGAVTGSLYQRFVLSSKGLFAVVGFAVFLAVLITFYRDGVLLTAAKQGGGYAFPILVWYVLARIFQVPTLSEVERKWFQNRVAGANRRGVGVQGDLALARLPDAVRRRRLALRERSMEEGQGA